MTKVLRRFVRQYSSSLRMPLNPYSPNDNLAPGSLVGKKERGRKKTTSKASRAENWGEGNKGQLNGAEKLKRNTTADSITAIRSNFVKIMGYCKAVVSNPSTSEFRSSSLA